MMQPRLVQLDTALEQAAPYYLGDGIADLFPSALLPHQFDAIAMVTTPLLLEMFGTELMAALRDHGVHPRVVLVRDGEEYKNWETMISVCEQLVDHGITRDSIVVALGGGVVGNMTGLAAGLLYRGVRYVEVPTTLMAQTDGVLSNKQAINGRQGKNQFGLYHAPLFVWTDISYARREPARQTKSAIVEGIKNGLVNDSVWLDRLSGYLHNGLEWILSNLRDVVLGLVESKRAILRKDPSEKRDAIILEYGHTFGHAIEWLSRGSLHHGEAVGLGMCAAAEMSCALGIARREVVDLHYHLLGDLLRAPVKLPSGIDPHTVVQSMSTDNKRRGPQVRCLLLERAGQPYAPNGDYLVPVSKQDALQALARLCAAAAAA